MHSATQERRVKLLLVNPSALINAMSHEGQMVSFSGLPEDARFLGCYYNEQTEVLHLTVESDNFPAVPEGNVLEKFQVTVTTHPSGMPAKGPFPIVFEGESLTAVAYEVMTAKGRPEVSTNGDLTETHSITGVVAYLADGSAYWRAGECAPWEKLRGPDAPCLSMQGG